MKTQTKNFDVVIIGGGVIGLALARTLAKSGVKKIALLERGETGRKSSFVAAGMLAPQAEANSRDVFFDFCVDSRNLYENFSHELLEETGIDIELDRSGTLYAAFNEKDSTQIRARFDWQKAAKLAVELLSTEDALKLEPLLSPSVREALFFPDDWQVETRALLLALRKFAGRNSVQIFENCEVRKINLTSGRLTEIESASGRFAAETVVLATGAWTSLIEISSGNLNVPKVKPIRGQRITFQSGKRLFRHTIYSPRGYLVPRRNWNILAGATAEDVGFDDRVTGEAVARLTQNAREISPYVEKLEIAEKCSGLRPFAGDGFPVIGAIPECENLFVATAHYRNGILLAPMTSKILADKILGGINSKYLDAFAASRFALAALGQTS